MCLAVPAKIISVKKDQAVVDFGGVEKEINISLVQVKKGDYVIVHAGFAISVLDSIGVKEILKLYGKNG